MNYAYFVRKHDRQYLAVCLLGTHQVVVNMQVNTVQVQCTKTFQGESRSWVVGSQDISNTRRTDYVAGLPPGNIDLSQASIKESCGGVVSTTLTVFEDGDAPLITPSLFLIFSPTLDDVRGLYSIVSSSYTLAQRESHPSTQRTPSEPS